MMLFRGYNTLKYNASVTLGQVQVASVFSLSHLQLLVVTRPALVSF